MVDIKVWKKMLGVISGMVMRKNRCRLAQTSGGCGPEADDADIAERLCAPSELKRKKGGDLQPSSRETWLDCQARALSQAARIVLKEAVK